jgi:hypothetical protein
MAAASVRGLLLALSVTFCAASPRSAAAVPRSAAAPPEGTVSFEIAPNSWMLALLVSPLRVVFDAKTRSPLRYEGPSPVMLESGSQLESFDARIEYSERAPVFR